MPELQLLQNLGIALVIGLLVGMERGWQRRDSAEGSRTAGVRTFALIGLSGGLAASFETKLSTWVLGAGLVSLTLLLIAARFPSAKESRDYGATTEVAAITTFLLGALSASGYPLVSLSGAVVTAGLLSLKGFLHDALRRLRDYELIAALELALITAVVLPFLPNRGFGPWELLNPFKLWLMVVLICSISFVGHFAVRLAGAKLGLFMTGLFAGLASSTALTLSFARTGSRQPPLQGLLAAGVVVACTTMFPRVLIEVLFLNRALFERLWPFVAVLTLLGAGAGLWLWRRGGKREPDSEHSQFTHPFELGTAIKFALVLAAVWYAAEAGKRYLGDAGVYAVALVSGLTDVDAITLSLSSMAGSDLSESVAARGILLATLSNTAVKAGIVAVVCGGAMARAVALSLGTLIAAGGLLLTLLNGAT